MERLVAMGLVNRKFWYYRFMKQYKLKPLLVVFIVIFLFGMAFYRYVEGLSWVDSFYFVGTTLNALGHAEYYPTSDISKIFTTIFSFVGVIWVIFVINVIANQDTE